MRNKILVAEDHDIIREIQIELLAGFLEQGYEIEEFKDGGSLERRLNCGVEDVSLVITDNEMPYVNGSEIISKYARKFKFPFVLIYGGVESIGEQAIEDGAFRYLIKPFGFSQYANLICDALKFSKD